MHVAGVAGLLLLVVGAPAAAAAQNATAPGAVSSPYPTLENLAIAWEISGDDNLDGVVAVRYREAGAKDWRTGLPLFRIPAGSNSTGSFGTGNGRWSNKHSGSLFDLKPDTPYEIELTLTDPDGGGTTKTLSARTRPVPQAAASSVTKNVAPSTLSSNLSGAQPGDILLLGAGSYPGFTLSKSGTSAKPLVIRGSAADPVTINGDVVTEDLEWVFLEGVTVNGTIQMSGSSNMVVRGCVVRSAGNGIDAEVGSKVPSNNYIADNDVIGPCAFENDRLSSTGCDAGEGILITGPGNVVAYNHVKGFRDNLTQMEYEEAYDQQCNDFYNNDLEEATDDAVEADSAMGNVRVMRNRITNSFDGISSQPGLGGPTYFIRNTMYNVLYTPFKLHNGTVGDVILHNTVVKNGDAFGCYSGAPVSRAYVRNNLFIGGEGFGTYGCCGNGSGLMLQIPDADDTCSFDYDAFGAIGISGFAGAVGATRYSSLGEMQSKTPEKHALRVDMSVFAGSVAHPKSAFPNPLYGPPDLRPATDGAVLDKGMVLPNVSDGFAGAAPDLGAYEAGSEFPHYGPRTGSPANPADAGLPGPVDGGSPGLDAGAPDSTDAGISSRDAGPGDAAAASSDGGSGADGAAVVAVGPFGAGCSCDSGGAATALAALPGVLLGLGFRRRPRWCA
jgi:hypothetical protein